jgi:hypothetical protein
MRSANPSNAAIGRAFGALAEATSGRTPSPVRRIHTRPTVHSDLCSKVTKDVDGDTRSCL